jgi:hypothetical protein
MHLLNVGLLQQDYSALYPRRLSSSAPYFFRYMQQMHGLESVNRLATGLISIPHGGNDFLFAARAQTD